MSKTIHGAAPTIARSKITQMCAGLGFDPHVVKSITLDANGVEAVIFDTDERGAKFKRPGRREYVKHTIRYRVVEDVA